MSHEAGRGRGMDRLAVAGAARQGDRATAPALLLSHRPVTSLEQIPGDTTFTCHSDPALSGSVYPTVEHGRRGGGLGIRWRAILRYTAWTGRWPTAEGRGAHVLVRAGGGANGHR
jgi:hypothetical protein